jgi:hypothetical protein
MQPNHILDAILNLDEPWQSRFMTTIAEMATYSTWNGGGRPADEDVLNWLQADINLQLFVERMLKDWRKDDRMKDALHPETYERVIATPEAPKEAICPICGETVVLRIRSDVGTAHYRHKHGAGEGCSRRPSFSE